MYFLLIFYEHEKQNFKVERQSIERLHFQPVKVVLPLHFYVITCSKYPKEKRHYPHEVNARGKTSEGYP
jgi:hypothetical protein